MIKIEKKLNNISYVLQFIDSAIFIASSFSNLVNNHFGGVHRIKGKLEYTDKKSQACRAKYKYSNCFLEHTNLKDDLIEYK